MENKNEFSFRFNFLDNVSLKDKDKLWEDFIFLFIEENNWYCGGSYNQATVYDINDKVKYSNFQTKTLDQLKLKYTDLLKSLTVCKFDENLDMFIDIKILNI